MKNKPTRPTVEEIKQHRNETGLSLQSSKAYLTGIYKVDLKEYLMEELDCAPSLVKVRMIVKDILEELV